MSRRRVHDSVFDEPHMRATVGPVPPAPQPPAEPADAIRSESPLDSIWNEPAMAVQNAATGSGADAPYARWLVEGRARYGWGRSWLVTLGLMLAAGPLALLSAFWGAGQTWFSVLALTVFGPLVEEMGKIMAALVTVEKWPFAFRSAWQIIVCCAMGGAVFAVIENLLYLHVYVREPSAELIYWRWTVCTALHVGCSLIAAWGVVHVWKDVWQHHRPPRVELGYPFWMTAIVIHGVYNAFALMFEMLVSPF
ncbi:MAG: PrsW family intramembrane metalloprotease [Planctomycetaceae bacterium]|nr:MAG: PrsW family intramembrane metalloprotease [Planctomycetaceae bacterium]